MQRALSLTMTVLVVLATVAVAPAVGAVVGPPGEQTTAAEQVATGEQAAATAAAQEENETNATAPGEQFAGVVGVQEHEIEGEIESRSFGLSIARASSDEARAALIAAEVNETGQELSDLQQEREELREARRNGSISEGQYRARLAELATRTENARQLTNQSANASAGLPAELLEANGVDASAIQQLRDQARNLSGPGVADIARSIAGEPGGFGERGPPEDRGPDRGDGQDGTDGENPGDGNGADGQDRGNGQDGADGQDRDNGENRGETPTGTETDDTSDGSGVTEMPEGTITTDSTDDERDGDRDENNSAGNAS